MGDPDLVGPHQKTKKKKKKEKESSLPEHIRRTAKRGSNQASFLLPKEERKGKTHHGG